MKVTFATLLILLSTSIVSAHPDASNAEPEMIDSSAPKTRVLSTEEMLSMEKINQRDIKTDSKSEKFSSWQSLITITKK